MTSMAPWLKRGPIGDDILKKIYASDQDMYPAPLTYSWLKSWVSACPDLSLCFSAAPEDNGGGEPVPVGAVIVLPLKKEYWEAVLTGKLKETSIDASTMFAGSTELVDVGLHVFHIERFKQTASLGRLRHFAEFALEDTREIVDGKPWNILGYSALTASPAGRAVCKRMGFKATGYEEIFVTLKTSGGKIEMVCVYPGEHENLLEAGSILSKSEMVVRYENKQFWKED